MSHTASAPAWQRDGQTVDPFGLGRRETRRVPLRSSALVDDARHRARSCLIRMGVVFIQFSGTTMY
jgi:hypothetical protein